MNEGMAAVYLMNVVIAQQPQGMKAKGGHLERVHTEITLYDTDGFIEELVLGGRSVVIATNPTVVSDTGEVVDNIPSEPQLLGNG